MEQGPTTKEEAVRWQLLAHLVYCKQMVAIKENTNVVCNATSHEHQRFLGKCLLE
jgi:hypothetical protein